MPTQLVNNRQKALKVGFEATDWSTPTDWQAYLQRIAGWDASLIERDGKAIGAVFRKGEEVHVSVLPEWRGRWATRGIIDQVLGQGRVVTQVGEARWMANILERLGFKQAGQYHVREALNGH